MNIGFEVCAIGIFSSCLVSMDRAVAKTMHITNLYIIENTGVGKSAICNLLLGQWEFDSKNQADSCTREVTFKDMWLPNTAPDKVVERANGFPDTTRYYRIFNIPGLLEADPERVRQNVRILQSALDRLEFSMILYVLTTESGRIRDSDYAAFKALSESYNLYAHSFAFLVNKTTKHDDKAMITQYVQKMLAPFPVAFLPHFAFSDAEFKTQIEPLSKEIRPMVMDVVQRLEAHILVKTQELKLGALEHDKMSRYRNDTGYCGRTFVLKFTSCIKTSRSRF